MGFTIFTIMGLFLVNALALYINIYHVFGGKKEAVSTLNGVAGTIFQLAGLGLAPVVAIVARRLGKLPTLLSGLTFVGIGFASSWWTYTPAFPYLQIASLALISPGLSCLWILGPSMLADTCERDAQTTGLRREGMFNASYVWCIKVGSSLTLVLSGYMLSWSGFDPELEVQPDGVLTTLRLLYAIVPVVFVGAAAACVLAYPKEDLKR
jgi:GPH family glycoside/pentoside/hexuronide:cation symporter